MPTWNDRLRAAFAQTGDDFERKIVTVTAGDLRGEAPASFCALGEKFAYLPVGDRVRWMPRNNSPELSNGVVVWRAAL